LRSGTTFCRLQAGSVSCSKSARLCCSSGSKEVLLPICVRSGGVRDPLDVLSHDVVVFSSSPLPKQTSPYSLSLQSCIETCPHETSLYTRCMRIKCSKFGSRCRTSASRAWPIVPSNQCRCAETGSLMQHLHALSRGPVMIDFTQAMCCNRW